MVRHAVYQAEVREGYAKGVIESHDPYGTAETNILNQEFAVTGFQYGDPLDITIRRGTEKKFSMKKPCMQRPLEMWR